jgi:hypothetical protein
MADSIWLYHFTIKIPMLAFPPFLSCPPSQWVALLTFLCLLCHLPHHHPHHYVLKPHQTFNYAWILKAFSCLLTFLFPLHVLENFYSVKFHLLLETPWVIQVERVLQFIVQSFLIACVRSFCLMFPCWADVELVSVANNWITILGCWPSFHLPL